MEFDNDCSMDADYLNTAKLHGMTAEEFYKMPEKQRNEVYCNFCKNWDCHAKREPYK